MKIVFKGTQKALKDIPRKQRKYIFDAIRKSTNEGVRLAKTLAPRDTGDLINGIHRKIELTRATRTEGGAIVASVEAAPPDAQSQIKALSVEFGRKYTRTRRYPRRTGKKFSGTTEANPFMRRTQSIIGPKHKGRIRRAMNKAAKEVGLA